MKFTIDKSALLSVLHTAAQVADHRSTMPILANVLLKADKGAVTVAATDLNITAVAEVACTVATPGALTLPAKQILDVVRGMGEKVTIEGDDRHYAIVTSGKQRYEVPGMKADDFPQLPKMPASFAPIGPAPFSKLLERVQFSCSEGTEKAYADGIAFENVDGLTRAVATDGHRLARCTMDIGAVSFPPGVILLRTHAIKFSAAASEAPDAALAFGKFHDSPHAFLRCTNVTLVAKMKEVLYPPYAQLIPTKKDSIAIVSNEAFTAAADRVGKIAGSAKTSGVKIKFAPGECTIDTESPERGTGSEAIDLKYDGAEVVIGVNALYVKSAGEACGTTDLQLEFKEPLDPLLIRSVGDDSWVGVIMPMHL